MDIKEFARLGGQARASKLSALRRKEIAINAISKRWNTCKQVSTNKPIEEEYTGGCKKCGRAEFVHIPRYMPTGLHKFE